MVINNETTDYLSNEEIDYLLGSSQNELIIENVKEQLDEPFGRNYINYLEVYDDKYKMIKKSAEDEEYVEKIKEERRDLMSLVINSIQEKFEFELDTENLKIPKTAKVLYDFFIINYNKNIITFLINYIMKNKKIIINEIKRTKRNKNKDVSTIASKQIFTQQNEALIITNIYFIIFDIIKGIELDEAFLQFIVNSDNNFSYKEIQNIFLKSDIVNYNDNLFETFMKPLFDMENGYCEIISELIDELSNLFNIKTGMIDII